MRAPHYQTVPVKLLARLAFGAIVVLATLSPWRFEADAALVLANLERALRPTLSARDAVDGLRNLVLFAGWGAVWYVTASAGRAWRVVAAATASGAALSFSVELLQLFSPVRTASPLDLLTNTLGALAGALAVLLLIGATRATRGERSFVGLPAFLFAASYLAAALLEAFVPLFRQGMVPGAHGGPLERLRLVLFYLHFRPSFHLPWTELVLFLPAGALVVAALAERGRGYRAAGWVAAVGGSLLVALVGFARGLVGMPILPGAILGHAAGLGLGAAAAALGLPSLTVRLRGASRPAALLAAYALVLALWSWRPFVLETDLSTILSELAPERFVPLQAYAMRVELFSVVQVCLLFLLYLPLGALLAVWPLRARGPWRGLLPALYLAALLEGGQILLAHRYFEITDVLLQAAGAAVGWVVVRKAGFRPYGEVLAGLRAPRRDPTLAARRGSTQTAPPP